MSNETEQVVEQEPAVPEEMDASPEQQMEAEAGTTDNTAGDDFQQVEAKRLNETPSGDSGDVKLDVILDIPVTVGMEIGRTQLSIRNLLQLNQGSIVELDRLAGEPMDVLVNGTLVAHGEVVVVNEKFGIRLTDVVSPADRIKNLR